MSAWQIFLVHVVSYSISLGLGLRYGSGAILRLVAGLVAILAADKRSRADRALKVLRTLSTDAANQQRSVLRMARKRDGQTGRSMARFLEDLWRQVVGLPAELARGRAPSQSDARTWE